MIRLPYLTCDVFTDTPFGGNPLAVFTDTEGNAQLTGEEMQQIARELNLSETVFFLKPTTAEAAYRLRIFTPGAELPFAGHPTVGSAYAMHWLGLVNLHPSGTTDIVVEEGVGPIGIRFTTDSQGYLRSARLENRVPVEVRPLHLTRAQTAEVLGLTEADLTDTPLRAASVGVPFAMVEVTGLEALGRIRLNLSRYDEWMVPGWAQKLFVYTPTEDATYRARMFAPVIGVPEDPATGGACGAFAGMLGSLSASMDGELAWTVQQGYEMGRPSQLAITARKTQGTVEAVTVGGQAVWMSEGIFRLRK